MTATAGLRPGLHVARPRRITVAGAAAAHAALVVGIAALLSGLCAAADGQASWWRFVAVGSILAAGGVTGRHYVELPLRYTGTQGWYLVTAGLFALVGFGSVVYLSVGALDRGIGRTVFESTSGFTTVGMTAFGDVESLGKGILFFRAASNWIGGLFAISMAVILLPSMTRTSDLVSQQQRARGTRNGLAPTVRRGIRNVSLVYTATTAAIALAYFVAGMSAFDALAHGLSTISTGGFSTRTGSIGAFDSAAIEWISIIGMLVAGTSVALLWSARRGRLRSLTRSHELRWFLATIAASAVLIFWLERAGDIGFRTALLAAASFGSTTGFQSFAWDSWTGGSQTALLMLMATGAMSGSAGAGFGVLRVVTLVSYAKRELRLLLFPHMIAAVKVDRKPIPEETLRHTIAHLVLYAGVALGGAYAVALFEPDLRQSLLTAISGLSTTGLLPQADSAAELARGTRVVLATVMILGRLGITPVAVTVYDVLDGPRSWLRSRVRQ